MAKVIVVGGGFAGAAAAVSLAREGFAVDLLESRGSLGGRAYSTPPTESFPAPVDNGPHLLMGCYHETLLFLNRLGAPNPFHWIDPLKISWFAPGGRNLFLKCPSLPAPFHLLAGLWASNAFSFGEKLKLTRALLKLSKTPLELGRDVGTVAEFLDSSGQGPLAREYFWNPLCNAVMNVPVEVAPIRGLGEVLRRIFFGTRRDSAFAIAARPLSEIGFPLVEPLLKDGGGSVQFHEGVQAFRAEGKNFELVTRSGKSMTADALVWAVPPSSLAALWPQGTWKSIDGLGGLGKSPILSVHVILSQPVTSDHFVGLPGASFEWVFNRNANWGWKGGGQYLSFTASAANDLARRTERELVDLALWELRDRCPAAKDSVLLFSKVTREMAATFIWNTETGKLRLPCDTPLPNVFLAGDWTATGLPATIEGACLSGHRAAQKVADYLG